MEKRPAGITIISIIYLLIAGVGLYAGFSLATQNLFALATMLLLGISAIGLYIGQQWAWWLIGTLTLFSIIMNLPQFLMVVFNAGAIPEVHKYFLKSGGKLVIQGLILFFMFSQPVIRFFVLEKITHTKRFLILLAAVGGLFLVLYLW